MSDALASIKEFNLSTARLAAAAGPLLVERLVNMAQTSTDPEEVRKISETLLRWATLHTEKKDNVVFQPAVVTFDFSGGVIEVARPQAPPVQMVEVVDVPAVEAAQVPTPKLDADEQEAFVFGGQALADSLLSIDDE